MSSSRWSLDDVAAASRSVGSVEDRSPVAVGTAPSCRSVSSLPRRLADQQQPGRQAATAHTHSAHRSITTCTRRSRSASVASPASQVQILAHNSPGSRHALRRLTPRQQEQHTKLGDRSNPFSLLRHKPLVNKRGITKYHVVDYKSHFGQLTLPFPSSLSPATHPPLTSSRQAVQCIPGSCFLLGISPPNKGDGSHFCFEPSLHKPKFHLLISSPFQSTWYSAAMPPKDTELYDILEVTYEATDIQCVEINVAAGLPWALPLQTISPCPR